MNQGQVNFGLTKKPGSLSTLFLCTFLAATSSFFFLSGCGDSSTPATSNSAKATNSKKQSSGKGSQSQKSRNQSQTKKSKGNSGGQADPIAAAIAAKKKKPNSPIQSSSNSGQPQFQKKKQAATNFYPVTTKGLSAAEFGLRKLESKHLTLYTDHPADQTIDQFPKVFDKAVDQWKKFFNVTSEKFDDWKVDAFVMVAEEKFRRAKLLPKVPIPPGGFQQGNQIWVRVNPGPYYTRHLLLHEGTHAFCWYEYRALGPPWLSEGLAEYLAVHRWDGEKLQLAAKIKDRNQIPYWGRIKTLRDAASAKNVRSIQSVFSMSPKEFPKTSSYGWAWAAVNLLDNHPATHAHFRENLPDLIQSKTSISNVIKKCKPIGQQELSYNWYVMNSAIDYGVDPKDTAIEFLEDKLRKVPKDIPFSVPNNGKWLEVGSIDSGSWTIHVDGEFVIEKDESGQWKSTADGVTLEYYQGHPIGTLLAVAVPEKSSTNQNSFSNPVKIGSEGTIQVPSKSRLFLKINDNPMKLETNSGSLRVTVK